MKRHHESSDTPSARRNTVPIALPHDKSRADRAAELERLLERVATPATKAGRRQAQKSVPPDGLKLELVPDSLPAPSPSTDAANTAFVARTFALASGTTSSVDYIGLAKKEFEEGRIDQPLWARAFVEARGDESSAMPNYLRARAMVLRLKDRVRQSEGAMRQARTSVPTRAPAADSTSRRGVSSDEAHRRAGHDTNANAWLRSPITILAALISLVMAVTLIIASRSSDSTIEPAAARTSGEIRSGPALKPMSPSNAAAKKAIPGTGQEFRTAVQGLKDAGHWNDVVLQASAWTEREPENAAAWNELSIGYVNTQRLDDAHAAARKAVELAPKDAVFWRNLGQLSLDREVPIEALLAFEEATRWDPKDGYSFVQAGILNARLDHLSEAKLAFANALALNSSDVNARCGAAFVAQRQARPDEVKGSSKQPTSTGACRDLIDRASKTMDTWRPAQ